MTALAEPTYQSSGEQAQEGLTERRRQVGLAGLITTTIFPPPGGPLAPIDITTVPASFLEPSQHSAIEVAENDLGVDVLAVANSPLELAALLGALLLTGPSVEGEVLQLREEATDVFTSTQADWAQPSSADDDPVRNFAEYVMYGDTVLIEQSPARRTSPAALAATTLATRVMTGGVGGTGAIAALTHSDNALQIVVMGTSASLILSVAGSGLVLATHWVAQKLGL
jgi:hypothetical protein